MGFSWEEAFAAVPSLFLMEEGAALPAVPATGGRRCSMDVLRADWRVSCQACGAFTPATTGCSPEGGVFFPAMPAEVGAVGGAATLGLGERTSERRVGFSAAPAEVTLP